MLREHTERVHTRKRTEGYTRKGDTQREKRIQYMGEGYREERYIMGGIHEEEDIHGKKTTQIDGLYRG